MSKSRGKFFWWLSSWDGQRCLLEWIQIGSDKLGKVLGELTLLRFAFLGSRM
jgi:hypothetical protein